MAITKLLDEAATLNRLCEIEKQNFCGEAWNIAQLQDTLHNPLCHTYGCYEGQVMVGYCAIIVADDADVCNVVVDKPFRNKGYGKQMMDFMLQLCRQEKVSNVFLDVNTANVAAIALYRHYGFEVLSVRRNYYPATNEHGSRHAFTMVKKL